MIADGQIGPLPIRASAMSAATTRPAAPGGDILLPLLVLTMLAVAVRWQTFGNPVIGFDEQFYLLVGDRMRAGVLPFVDIFDRKPVGLFLIYALGSMLGPDAFLGYKLLALGAVVATAFMIHRLARRSAGSAGALIGASLYILWLNFMEGEGGQAPVFYNAVMIGAAMLVERVMSRRASPGWTGGAAMLLVGVALQIKYSVVVEGIWFGCALMLAAWRAGVGTGRLAALVLAWIACALLPTALAWASYAALGHGDAFVFANFLSVLGQGRGGGGVQVEGALAIAGIVAPLAIGLLLGWRGRSRGLAGDPIRFRLGWLVASVAGIVLYWRFASPHYAMPLLVPLCVLIAPVIDAGRGRRYAGIGLVLLALVGGQAVLAITTRGKGGADAAQAVARAAHAERGCIYVYDGYPALYMLTGSCLPTRWVFPGHLSLREEARATALGIDPLVEIARIMATRPVAIVDDFPRFSGGNPAAHAILQRTLDRDYTLAACIPTGADRVRLVYRRRSEGLPRPAACPDDAALRRGRASPA
jgi:hypothetical protein